MDRIWRPWLGDLQGYRGSSRCSRCDGSDARRGPSRLTRQDTETWNSSGCDESLTTSSAAGPDAVGRLGRSRTIRCLPGQRGPASAPPSFRRRNHGQNRGSIGGEASWDHTALRHRPWEVPRLSGPAPRLSAPQPAAAAHRIWRDRLIRRRRARGFDPMPFIPAPCSGHGSTLCRPPTRPNARLGVADPVRRSALPAVPTPCRRWAAGGPERDLARYRPPPASAVWPNRVQACGGGGHRPSRSPGSRERGFPCRDRHNPADVRPDRRPWRLRSVRREMATARR